MHDRSDVELNEAAESWCRYHARAIEGTSRGLDDPDWWAVELWLEGWQDETQTRKALLALIDAATDDLLSYVGAGPMEAFVSADESRLRWIEAQATRSARFRSALANVWAWGDQSEEVAARLERAAGVPLAKPKHWPNP